MKITIDFGDDKELRKEILNFVAEQIKKVSVEDIKDVVLDYLKNDVKGKITDTLFGILKKNG